jgi:hypothetical protein
VTIVHPDFEPLKRMVEIKSGSRVTLEIDLKDEAVRRRK